MSVNKRKAKLEEKIKSFLKTENLEKATDKISKLMEESGKAIKRSTELRQKLESEAADISLDEDIRFAKELANDSLDILGKKTKRG